MRLSGTPTRVAVGNPMVADIKILSFVSGAAGQVLLVANTPGTTDVQAGVGRHSMPVRWRVKVVSGVRHVLESQGGPLQAGVNVADGQAVLTGESGSLLEHQRSAAAATAAAGAGKTIDLSRIGTSGVVQVNVKVGEVSRSVVKARSEKRREGEE